MLIAGLIGIVLVQTAMLININKQRDKAGHAASCFSDIIRIHLDSEFSNDCGFDDMVFDYLDEEENVKLNKWVWCY